MILREKMVYSKKHRKGLILINRSKAIGFGRDEYEIYNYLAALYQRA